MRVNMNYSEVDNGGCESEISKARHSHTSSIPEFFCDVRTEGSPYLCDCLLIEHTVLLEEPFIRNEIVDQVTFRKMY
jgi:hypothetical protein